LTTSFDLSPGAQVPLTDVAKQSAATQMLSSAAYRDGKMEELTKLSEGTSQKAGRFSLLEPTLGEAFCRAVQVRMLGAGRSPVIQSFGLDPMAVVQHCLAASRIRRSRDLRLTAVMAVFGLLFLPGTLVWIGAFQLKRTLTRMASNRVSPLGGVVIAAVAVFAVLFAVRPPFTGLAQLYMRLILLAPVAGWFLAKRICTATAGELRKRWTDTLEGAGAGPTIPETVPSGPNDTRAERLRVELEKLAAEQNSNVVFYRGRDGILGMGPRWGSWSMAEELTPKPGHSDINQFRAWDVIKVIHGALRDLERGPLHSGGFPRPTVRHWIVVPIAEGAGSVSRPSGPEVDGYSVRDFEIQRICNEQQFGSGNRHYLGVQFVLWEGQLVLNLLCTVTVLHRTLRIDVTGHTLGPVAPSLSSKPEPKTKDVPKSIKFWETKKVTLPLVTAEEVVRCSVRAPLMWIPPLLEWAGGKLALPEPFGLRHSWVEPPWTHRFMADDALRAATPVVRAVHAAAIRFLDDNNVDTEKFVSRSLNLGGAVQGATPGKPDAYDA
jgi:multisubunit Na+/H+ antiporter MnhG subunit